MILFESSIPMFAVGNACEFLCSSAKLSYSCNVFSSVCVCVCVCAAMCICPSVQALLQ